MNKILDTDTTKIRQKVYKKTFALLKQSDPDRKHAVITVEKQGIEDTLTKLEMDVMATQCPIDEELAYDNAANEITEHYINVDHSMPIFTIRGESATKNTKIARGAFIMAGAIAGAFAGIELNEYISSFMEMSNLTKVIVPITGAGILGAVGGYLASIPQMINRKNWVHKRHIEDLFHLENEPVEIQDKNRFYQS